MLWMRTLFRVLCKGLCKGYARGQKSEANSAWMLHPPLGLDTLYDTLGKETSMEVKTMFQQASVICHSVLILQRQSTCKPPGWQRGAAIGTPRLLHDYATCQICHSEHQSKKIHCAKFQTAVINQLGCAFLLQVGLIVPTLNLFFFKQLSLTASVVHAPTRR